MALGKVVYDVLSTDANVISLVGDNKAGDGKRIFPIRVSYKESFPLVIYSIKIDPTNDKDGVSKLDVAELTTMIYASAYTDVVTLSGYVRNALDGYNGTNNGVIVDRISFTSQMDDFDEHAEVRIIIQEYNARIKN